MKRAALIALVAACASCAETPLTQLVVVVDTNLDVPEQLDTIEIVVEAPEGAPHSRVASFSEADANLPVTLGVVHRAGALGPVHVHVSGRLGPDELVVRDATLTLRRGVTLVLELHLSAECVGLECPADMTCAGGECRSIELAPGELRVWDGMTPRLGDGGMGCFATELCNGVDDDCDGAIDEGIDLAADPYNCGACRTACPGSLHAAGTCTAGSCGVRCLEGYGDCDGDPRTGCETPLDSLAMCGACGVECAPAHADATCFTSTCDVSSCAPGYGDCNDQVPDGCEMRLDDVANCGTCGRACSPMNATPSCAGGVCAFSECAPGFDDCDGIVSNGCEAPLDTTRDCGVCARPCADVPFGSEACVAARCEVQSCEVGYADCNRVFEDGCETSLRSLSDCGGCGVSCVREHALESCTSGTCRVASCELGFGDCDLDDSNGCEVDFASAVNCGMCGRACSGATPLCTGAPGFRTCGSACDLGETLCGMECVETNTSLAHCGGCGRVCALANATSTCSAGACDIAACDPGHADCNGLASDGCERALGTSADCASCGDRCEVTAGIAECTGGACRILSCPAGWGDCNGIYADACETALNTSTSCGACGVSCALPHAVSSCSTGACLITTCEPGFANCNGVTADGCETSLSTLTDCSGCGVTCELPRASETCASGTCALASCDVGWGDCNASATDGCETALTTLSDCAGCGMSCGPFPNASATCGTGMCVSVCLTGFGDCSAAPGCETPLNTLANCGGCGVACSAAGDTPTCASGACAVMSCRRDRADCDANPYNGCETRIDRSVLHCGGCDQPCDAGESCSDGVCD